MRLFSGVSFMRYTIQIFDLDGHEVNISRSSIWEILSRVVACQGHTHMPLGMGEINSIADLTAMLLIQHPQDAQIMQQHDLILIL